MECFLLVALATVFEDKTPQSNQIWIANGVLLAFLLLTPRRRWPAYLCTGFAAQVVGTALVSLHWQMNLSLVALNMTEVLLGAALLRRRSADVPCFTDRGYLLRFTGYAVLAAPLATGALYTLLSAFLFQKPPGPAWIEWVLADSLGTAVAVPACVAMYRAHFRKAKKYWNHLGYLLLLLATILGAFSQTTVPLAYLIYPILILILLRLGMGWASMATLLVTVAGNWFTVRGMGPFAKSYALTRLAPSILMDLFIAAVLFMLYGISLVLERQRASERRLQKIAALHDMVTENSRDTIILADFDGHRSYVSAAASSISGWTSEELLKQDSYELVHPLDLEKMQEAMRELRAKGGSAVVECRIQKRTGEYTWVESSLRVVHDRRTGAISGVLNLVRDIAERKQAEQRLQDAYSAVEALAVTDALTGLANRRRFDQCLTTEWRRGMRERTPLSVLMIDADLFKKYNDTYGHPRGDSCLKQIAEAALDVVSRPGDLVARFGGEEFTVILPNTDNAGALRVGTEICEAMRNRRLPHSGNPFGIVTISLGCATMIPKLGQHAPDLLEMADQALYQAKHNGRNQVSNGNATMAADEEARGEAEPDDPMEKTA